MNSSARVSSLTFVADEMLVYDGEDVKKMWALPSDYIWYGTTTFNYDELPYVSSTPRG